jgi:signal transduction histidine kinase
LIRWIQDHPWTSSAALAGFALLLFGGLDLVLQGYEALLVTGLLAAAVLFAAKFPPLSIGLIVIGTSLEIFLGLAPVLGGLSAPIALFLIAAFAERLWSYIFLGVTIVSGLAVSWTNSFLLADGSSLYGLILKSESDKAIAFLLFTLVVGTGNTLFWLLGRLAITYEVYVGTEFDRVLSAQTQAKLSLEVAEQNERFDIARDINELTIQKVAAVISQAEGGSYAAKANPESALRSLERITASARAAHAELRRLYDMLNKSHTVSAAPPGLNELDNLVVTYREFGFDVSINHEGNRFEISEGAALVIYRIVFDALANARKHCIIGTNISIGFSWVDEGLQVLVKDNGIEANRRSDSGLEALGSGYTAEDDVRALVEVIQGAGLTAMRERAALYAGTVEATRVPGVGFTVSAIFPKLRALAGTSSRD